MKKILKKLLNISSGYFLFMNRYFNNKHIMKSFNSIIIPEDEFSINEKEALEDLSLTIKSTIENFKFKNYDGALPTKDIDISLIFYKTLN